MYQPLFNEFLASDDTLRVYEDDRLLFSSGKDRLLPLLEYIDRFSAHHQQVIIFDKIMGNAAALLSVKAGSDEVYSPLGSQLAVETFERYDIKYHITKLVRYIQQANREEMCPMERLSLDKGPEEFYQVMSNIARKKGEEHG